MAIKHISDEQIQSFIDNSLNPAELSIVEKHLEICPECRQVEAFYRSLAVQVKQGTRVQLSPRFSKKVMKKIKRQQLGSVHADLWYVFLILFGIIITINSTLSNVDIPVLWKNLKNDWSLLLPDSDAVLKIFHSAGIVLGQINPIILISIAVLIFFIVLDYLLSHFRQRFFSLF